MNRRQFITALTVAPLAIAAAKLLPAAVPEPEPNYRLYGGARGSGKAYRLVGCDGRYFLFSPDRVDELDLSRWGIRYSQVSDPYQWDNLTRS